MSTPRIQDRSRGPEKPSNVVQGYTRAVLEPQLKSLGLADRQGKIVVADVTTRLESLLSHWHDLPFRRTILVLGTEEASFWEPRDASLEIRSMVVVGIRHSLITDLNASHAYTEALRSRRELLPDELMPAITGDAIKYFQASNLDTEHVRPAADIFGSLPRRFPNAWHALSPLGSSSNMEIPCELSRAEAEPMDFSVGRRTVENHYVIASGIDPGLDSILSDVLQQIARRELDLFISSSFKGITRNPEKLLSIIDHVLRHGGTLLTPNYLLSPTYIARRIPLIRPAHTTSDFESQIRNPIGLSDRHKEALASIAG